MIFGLIIGGRIGYVIFYNPSYYLNNPIEIIMIWNGGMSFHGGVIGVVLSTIIFCKKNNEEIFYFLDLVALSAPIGIFLGRISNFINSELYGRETNVFWSVKFISVDDLYRHPSQIYEALFEGIILFIILNILYKSLENRTGLISALFLILYSFFRFFIEYFREPDSHLGFIYFNLSLGQIACIITFIFGSILFYYLKNAERNEKIPLDEFINKSLFDDEKGYYMIKNPIGKNGDFITSPNISVMFSEMISIWLISFWEKLGSPKKINIIELGGGNGEMMYQIIKTINNFKNFKKAAEFIIIDKSPILTSIQKRN